MRPASLRFGKLGVSLEMQHEQATWKGVPVSNYWSGVNVFQLIDYRQTNRRERNPKRCV